MSVEFQDFLNIENNIDKGERGENHEFAVSLHKLITHY